MKVKARVLVGEHPITVAIDLESFWRGKRTVYATWFGDRWLRSSGREVTRKMLDAIDELQLVAAEPEHRLLRRIR